MAAALPGGIVAAVIGYAIGGIPVGLLIARAIRRVDLRQHGSGRIGATNVLRTLGPAAAAGVLLLDVAKGVVAVLIGRWLLDGVPGMAEWGAAAGGVAAVLGHVFSPFIGLRGGRGVATTAGCLLVTAPLALVVLAPAVVVVAWQTRYMSLGSIVGAMLAPVVVGLLAVSGRAEPADVAFAGAAGIIVIVAHRDNVERLQAGSERRIGEREELPDDG